MNTPKPIRCIVLSTGHAYESDKRVEVFSALHGRFTCRAKGALRSLKRFGGRLEPTTVLDIYCWNRSALPLMLDCEVVHSFTSIRHSFNAISVAMYAIQICRLSTVEYQVNQPLFAGLYALLTALDHGGVPQMVMSEFETLFLNLEGIQSKGPFATIFQDYTGRVLPPPVLI